ncbi:iron-containing alcohol dehydrogenase [Actinomycetospora sp. CA-101289]|uniref:iron-containing alcohol dehydrogenase n=1 Tax=Actinomycetospora sp. CA-101289 TaxID=3239893 RepID=UPI003D998379
MTDAPTVRRFDIPRVERVLEGPGALAALAEEVDERGARRVAVLSGRSVAALPELDGLRSALGDRLVVERDDVHPHNPSAAVAEIAAAVRAAGADMVVAIGGGSPIDAAKLVAFALAEDITDADALGRAVDHPPAGLAPLPVVAVPTTLSAAEWTGLAGLTVEREQTKHALFHPRLVPAVVVLDPDLARHTPRSLWTTTGVRAVDHAVETIYARDAHPFGTALCREALALLGEHLPRAADDPDDREATLACQRAAELSALTLTNVSVGLSHAVGHQLGAAGVPPRRHVVRDAPPRPALRGPARPGGDGDDRDGAGRRHRRGAGAARRPARPPRRAPPAARRGHRRGRPRRDRRRDDARDPGPGRLPAPGVGAGRPRSPRRRPLRLLRRPRRR